MISYDSRCTPIHIRAPLSSSNYYCKQLFLVDRVVQFGTGELMRKVRHGLETGPLILLQYRTHSVVRGICFNDERFLWAQVGQSQHRMATQSGSQRFKRVLLVGGPRPSSILSQQLR